MTGTFDTLSSADEVGYGNWRVVKNATTRSTRNRQRGGGWRRLFSETENYNNQDLHDQLTDRLWFYDEYSSTAEGGGGLGGYLYPYFHGSYSLGGGSLFPPATDFHCPVYLGDFPSGRYNGCPIFYPVTGYPYEFIPGFVSTTGATANWKFNEIAATTPDSIGGLDLTNFGPSVETGLLGNALRFNTGDYLESADATFQTGDIRFGFTGWIKRYNTGASSETVLGRWAGAGQREYRLYLLSGQLVFEVSNDGTASTLVTGTLVLPLEEWTFLACP